MLGPIVGVKSADDVFGNVFELIFMTKAVTRFCLKAGS